MKKAIYLFVLGIVLFMGCKKSDVGSSGLKMEIQKISGWGNMVNITIDQHKTEIIYPKGSESGIRKDSIYDTSDNTLKQLTSYIKKYHLMDNKIQECARCADGTDYVIKIKSEGKENTVTIAGNRTDGKYMDLLEFIDKL